ncbi:MAG: ribbon-helix-helix domain-containing protein [Nanoarchaeota archaeon]|nr:ribbon-helix-helix domain-containing protein [Nanoarchaeota archaeon]
MKNQKYTTISIPVQLGEKIKKHIKGTGFQSVSDYVIFIIREMLSLESGKKTLSEDDKLKIINKLKALGYM